MLWETYNAHLAIRRDILAHLASFVRAHRFKSHRSDQIKTRIIPNRYWRWSGFNVAGKCGRDVGMGVYLRGNVWWFEVKTPTRRVRRSTGFGRDQRAKAQAVFDAARLAMRTRPPRDAAKAILDAIYSRVEDRPHGLPVTSVWEVYLDWFSGKGKVVTNKEQRDRKTAVDAFAGWAASRRIATVDMVDVQAARAYVAQLGGANKTRRNKANALATVWEAVGQMMPGVHNPWRAACPDDDGSGERRDAFGQDERAAVLDAAGRAGHMWREISMVALYTAQRYSDCATLTWGDASAARASRNALEFGVVDLDEGLIVLDPSKTRRHGTRLVIPIARPLDEALRGIRGDVGDFVFAEHAARLSQGAHMSPSFSDVIADSGIRTIGRLLDFHSWRHTARTMLTEAGASRDVASRFGGWTTAKMGDHYDHAVDLAGMRAALDAMSVDVK